MLSYAAHFGELRSLLAQEITPQVWEALLERLGVIRDHYKTEYYGEVLPYAQEVLRESSRAVRPASSDWLSYENPLGFFDIGHEGAVNFVGGSGGSINIMDSRFPLCNAVSLGYSKDCFARAHQNEHFRHLEHLVWEGQRTPFRTLVNSGGYSEGYFPSFAKIPKDHSLLNLKSLTLYKMSTQKAPFQSFVAALQKNVYPNLEHLHWVEYGGSKRHTIILRNLWVKGKLGSVKTLDETLPSFYYRSGF